MMAERFRVLGHDYLIPSGGGYVRHDDGKGRQVFLRPSAQMKRSNPSVTGIALTAKDTPAGVDYAAKEIKNSLKRMQGSE